MTVIATAFHGIIGLYLTETFTTITCTERK